MDRFSVASTALMNPRAPRQPVSSPALHGVALIHAVVTRSYRMGDLYELSLGHFKIEYNM